jgi:ureidoglycolate lyase
LIWDKAQYQEKETVAMKVKIALEALCEERVAPFGRLTGTAARSTPDIEGEGWGCWYPAGEPNEPAPMLGIVRTEPRPLVVTVLERHQDREEWVYALDRPYIQVVALSSPDDAERPDSSTARAFRIEPGEGLILGRGVWHGVGLPAGDEATLYGFLLGKPGPDAEAANSGWVSFGDEVQVVVDRWK